MSEEARLIRREAALCERAGRYHLLRGYCQHGRVSVYAHSVRVAMLSLRIARRLRLRLDERALVRGALLHDYFLYDWHERGGGHRLHAFRHPGTALRNALRDYPLGPTEADIIRHHMFPLTVSPPRSREAWVVCLADKLSALHETLRLR